MIFPIVDINIWCKTYGLKIQVDECPKCGIKRETSIPYAIGKYRGLISEEHNCGPEFRLNTFKPSKGTWFNLLDDSEY